MICSIASADNFVIHPAKQSNLNRRQIIMTCFRFKTDHNQISSHDIDTQVRQTSDKNKCNDQLHLSVVLVMHSES